MPQRQAMHLLHAYAILEWRPDGKDMAHMRHMVELRADGFHYMVRCCQLRGPSWTRNHHFRPWLPGTSVAHTVAQKAPKTPHLTPG